MANLILILADQLTPGLSALEGGEWNYDAENRRKWTGKPPAPSPFRVEPDAATVTSSLKIRA
jgi:deoxyribodipyrimidine photolyase-like uncharacterized protein